MFAPRYFPFHYYASRYFPPPGVLVSDILRICTLNMVTHVGAIGATIETGAINMLTRCR